MNTDTSNEHIILTLTVRSIAIITRDTPVTRSELKIDSI